MQVLSTSDGVSETQTVEMRVLDGPGDAGDKDGRGDGRKREWEGGSVLQSDHGCQAHIISTVTLVARQLCKPSSPTPAKPAEPQPASQDPSTAPSTAPSFVRGSSGRTSWRVVPARPEKEEAGKEAGEEAGKEVRKAKQEKRKSE